MPSGSAALTRACHVVTLMKFFHSGRGKKTHITDARIAWDRVETGCIMSTQSWALQTLVDILKEKKRKESKTELLYFLQQTWCLCSTTYHNTLQKKQQKNWWSLLMTGNHPNTCSKSCQLCSYILHFLHRSRSHQEGLRCFHTHCNLY